MRLYIYKVTQRAHEQKPDTYDFTKSIESAWHWTTEEAAERVCRYLSETGITVDPPIGNSAPCIDFCVEPRPQGGFAISCEHPLASE